MIPSLIVRADAGPEIGLGHLVRSLALAQAWRARGGPVTLATATAPGDVPSSVDLEDVRIVRLSARHPDPRDAGAVSELLMGGGAAWVVVDGYHLDAGYTGALRRTGARVLVIDDQADQPTYHADALLNQSPGAERLPYRFEVPPLTLFGPRFALLPLAFARWRGRVPDARARPTRLLLTLGGAAPGTASTTLLQGCVPFLERHALRAAVLAAPGASTAAWTEAAAAARDPGSGPGPIEIVSDPPDVAALVASADLALSAAGSTAWQLCFLGVPMLLTAVAENQRPIAEGLAAAGCATDLGPLAGLDPSAIDRALERLFVDPDGRDRSSRTARALVDGLGAERVATALLAGAGGCA